MACSGDLASDIAEMKAAYLVILQSTQAARDANSLAKTHWDANQDHEAIYDIIVAINKQSDALDALHYRYAPFYPEYMLIHIIEQHLAAPTFDMDTLLNTLLGAEFEQLQKFIGITDAYKVAIWNAPFNQDFYAALARGFAQWQQS